jgi:hypothetical protein
VICSSAHLLLPPITIQSMLSFSIPSLLSPLLFLFLVLSVYSTPHFFYKYKGDNRSKLSQTTIGQFNLLWDQNEPYLHLSHQLNPNKTIFQTLPSWPFITVGYATDSVPPIVDGNYKVDEWTLFETPYQSIQKITPISTHSLTIIGDLWGLVTHATYSMNMYIPKDSTGKYLESQIEFNITVKSAQGSFNRVFLNYWCDPKETFHGFGVQVSQHVCNNCDFLSTIHVSYNSIHIGI